MNRQSVTTVLAAFFLMFCLSWPAAAQQMNPEEIKGKEIRDAQGKKLGDIEEVITGPGGEIEAVVVAKGGFLGLGEEERRIPWSELKEGQDPDTLVYAPGQQQQAQQQQKPQQQQDQQRQAQARQDQRLKGRTVESRQGERIGVIEQVIQGEQGVSYAVVVGKDKEVLPFPVQQLNVPQEKGKNIQAQVGPQEMEQMPRFSQEQWQRLSDRERQQEIRAYYEKGQAQGQKRSQMQEAQGQKQAMQDRDRAQGGQVTVRDPGTEVMVDPSKPEVQVQQSRPIVRVQQEPPTVTVRQPAPIITVRVEQPDPQVEVQQQQPRVTVEQPRPQVDVRQQQPEVTVRQQEGKPKVQVSKSDQAQVRMEGQQKANVRVEKMGEPKVRIVTEEQGRQTRGQQQQAMQQQQTGEQQRQRQAQARGQGVEPSRTQGWIGRTIATRDGQELGQITNNYLSEDRSSVMYVIVRGEDDQMHPLPAEMIREDQGELVAEIDRQEFQESPSFGQDERPELEDQEWSREIRAYYQQR